MFPPSLLGLYYRPLQHQAEQDLAWLANPPPHTLSLNWFLIFLDLDNSLDLSGTLICPRQLLLWHGVKPIIQSLASPVVNQLLAFLRDLELWT
jgi:hypothetical protein